MLCRCGVKPDYRLDEEVDEPREDDELDPAERPAEDGVLETGREDELFTDDLFPVLPDEERPELEVLVERPEDELFTLLPDERPVDEEDDDVDVPEFRDGWRTPDELF